MSQVLPHEKPVARDANGDVCNPSARALPGGTGMKCNITQEQEAALRLANECFGTASIEALYFLKFLIVEKQGLTWINEGVEPLDLESAR